MLRLIHDFAALFTRRSSPRRVELPRGGIAGISPGLRVAVEYGAVWMTLPGVPADTTLKRGESARVGRGAVFEALEPTIISITR